MAKYSNNPFGSATSHSSNNPFGSTTSNNPFGATNNPFGAAMSCKSNMDISADVEMINRNKNKEVMMDVLSSAVGDFTERPLQILIREVAKNFLIFTPIGWIILLFIIGRRYKSNLGNAAGKLNNVFDSAITSLGIPTKKASE